MDYGAVIRKQLDEYYAKWPNKELLDEQRMQKIIQAANDESLWKPVPGFQNYEANGVAGQVRHSKLSNACGKSQMLAGSKSNGYFLISGMKMGRARAIRMTFDRDRQPGETLDHIASGRPYDDCLDNTRWATSQEQSLNRRLPLKRKRTKVYITSKHPSFDVIVDDGITAEDASKKYGFSELSIAAIAFQSTNRLAGFFWKVKDERNPNEVWITITHWKGHQLNSVYQISDHGIFLNSYKHVSCGNIGANGYYFVSLRTIEGKTIQENVHVLVCTFFHGEKPSGTHTVDHINRNRTDNRSLNLRWATWEQQAHNRSNTRSELASFVC
jgi:hypothetical protein